MRAMRAVSACLITLLVLGIYVPAANGAQTGTTYTVQPGDSLGDIAATYGTTADAIMQANGLASGDMIWVGQSLIIPAQVAGAGTSASTSTGSANSYTVQVGDTVASIADQLGVTATALANANGLTNPDLLWVGQRLLIPGTTLGTAVSAPPAQPAAESSGYYTVQPGDTLRSIAVQLGTTPAAMVDANNLTNADLLFVGQRLALPGSAAAAAPATPTASSPATTEGGRYVVQPGDTLNSIAQSLNVTTDALARANQLANADVLTVGQSLVVPGASVATVVPDAALAPTAEPGAGPTKAPQATVAAPTAEPAAATGVPPTVSVIPTVAPAAGAQYVVKPGDTLNSIAQMLGVSTAALARANSLSNADALTVGQTLVIPDANAPVQPATVITPTVTTATPEAGANQQQSAPPQIRYTVQRGDTLGSIAQKYGMSAAALARANRISSPDLVSVGMTLLIPSPAWTAPDFAGTPSRFVASISLQRCWLYQGNRTVADWPCSTGQPGTETHPGSYKIQSKMDRAFGSTWNIWMPYWLGIYWAGASENGIHGIPYSASNSNWRLWEGWVGTPVTYGCVLLDDVHAKQLYDVAYIGMPVIIQP